MNLRQLARPRFQVSHARFCYGDSDSTPSGGAPGPGQGRRQHRGACAAPGRVIRRRASGSCRGRVILSDRPGAGRRTRAESLASSETRRLSGTAAIGSRIRLALWLRLGLSHRPRGPGDTETLRRARQRIRPLPGRGPAAPLAASPLENLVDRTHGAENASLLLSVASNDHWIDLQVTAK